MAYELSINQIPTTMLSESNLDRTGLLRRYASRNDDF